MYTTDQQVIFCQIRILMWQIGWKIELRVCLFIFLAILHLDALHISK